MKELTLWRLGVEKDSKQIKKYIYKVSADDNHWEEKMNQHKNDRAFHRGAILHRVVRKVLR